MPSTDDPRGPTDNSRGPTDDPRGPTSKRRSLRRNPKRLVHDPRLRALLLGFVLGIVAVPAFIGLAELPPREATSTAFALGALVLGFAVISWTGAVMLGPAVESLHDYMDLASGWTEASARQAFAILSALGFGVMLGSSIASMLV